MTQKVMTKGSLNPVKYCIDCSYSKIHSTGSQLWISCKFQKGWRSVNSVCNLSEEEKMMKQKFRKKVVVSNPKIQGLFPEKNSSQSFWTLKAKIELAIFREQKKGASK